MKVRNACLALGFVVVAGGVMPAQGGLLTLELITGSTTTVTDNGVGDLDPTTNIVTFSGTVGGFETVVTVGVSNDPGNPTGATLSLTNININNVGGATESMQIRISDADFSIPAVAGLLDSDLSASYINDFPVNSVSYTSYADDANTLFGTADESTVTLTLSTNGGLNTSSAVSLSAPYSLTGVMDITLAAGSTLTATGNTVVTPEPATAVLALVGLGAILSRRRYI